MLVVVCGPPAAGKSAWIAAHAKAHDVVIDYDKLAQALSGPNAPSHDHADVVQKVAHKARFAALDESLRHVRDHDVYLIHTQPSDRHLAKYKRYNARIVTVDPGRDVVLARAREQRSPERVAVVTRWYNQQAKRPTQGVTGRSSRQW